ncbi:MAG: cation-translocating P-type ATPase [Bacteroidaceae bacterium]|nr:cation-translocating P-type ATPase [Bacteroidaceae bacterium]MBQ8807628.1 cation-translocating P-type ATPase [Bacteroidaceae bacterium]
MTKNYYQQSVDEVVRQLGTDLTHGLSSTDVTTLQERDGLNEFAKKQHTSLWQKFIAQFKSFMIIVLLVAAVISGVTGYMNGEGITDAIIILSILIVNAIIGVFQEAKAENALDALEKLSAPHCKVIRNGEHQVIESRELVVGDIVEIETGDSVPADLRLTDSVNLKIQEAALTGESLPVDKTTATIADDVPIGDRTNMAFSSCSVTYGRGVGIVVATGEKTEVGKIAAMIKSVPDMRTPMQIRLDKLGKVLAIISLVVCAVIFIIGLCYGRGVMDMFMTAVSLAVAAIPEGLPAVSTVVLALGVQRLAKQNAIVRNLPSVETLGSTTVICSDKTGTLTQNKMTVVECYPKISTNLVIIGALCNDTTRGDGDTLIGDPTETALISYADNNFCRQEQCNELYPRIAERPFDSERKLMTTLHRKDKQTIFIATKGGFDELLAVCDRIEDDGKIRTITDADKKSLAAANTAMASKALRVLCMAYKEVGITEESDAEQLATLTANAESELIFVGMVGMIDPPREEARVAVEQCKRAGIKPVMITGDHKITASAIAQSLGIMTASDKVLTGGDVESMSDEELRNIAGSVSVFARVAPEHKVRIVKAYQKLGNVVAMTGDGVNDAPALKLANIGVAMGITGTDVSKEAADVVLADDNFATIVQSVREGRRIYDNLIKSIQFMISTNLGEIVLLLVAVLCNFDMPLLPIQLLFINLVGDSLPSLALSVDHAAKNIMSRKPIDPNQGIFTKAFTTKITVQALIIGAVTIAVYFIGLQHSIETARTMTFAVMIFSQFTMIFSIRSGNSWFTERFFSNRWLWATIVLVTGLTLLVMLIPAMQSLFKLTALTATQWWIVAGLSIGVLVLSEFCKLFTRNK